MAIPRSNAAGINATSFVGAGSSVLEVTNEARGVRDVWAFNLDEELRTIGRVVQRYKFVAMDTEFPGVVFKVIYHFPSREDYHYQSLQSNVNMLKIIQIGFPFIDDAGNKTPNYCIWQFNFSFSLTEDMYAQDSIDLLFERHEKEGIDPVKFALPFTVSGVVLLDDVKLICFHGAYEMANLLKLLTNQPLPTEKSDFVEVKIYFPVVYDVQRPENAGRQAGAGIDRDAISGRSDSLRSGEFFFKIREVFF